MINMAQKELKVEIKQICSICSSAEEEEVDNQQLNKWQKLNQPKKHLILLQRIFTMVELLKWNIQDRDAVKNAMVKEVKMLRNVKHAKEKVSLYRYNINFINLINRCIKWVRECINRSRSIVINAQVKVKLFQKAQNANNVKVKKYLKKRKLLKYQSKKEHQIIIQSPYLVKVMKFQMHLLVIQFSSLKKKNIKYSREKARICS